jgi:type IV fimbrial biogenesis protein FimT
MSKSQQGLTLLELLVVLAVGAIIMSVGVPGFRNLIADSRVRTATNDLISSAVLARSEAIKRVKYVTLCRSSNGRNCNGRAADWNVGWIVFANATPDRLGRLDGDDELIRVYPALPDGISIESSGTFDGFVAFRPTGTAGTSGRNQRGTLTICDFRGVEEARAAIIETSGRTSVSHDLRHDGETLECPT